MKHIILLVALLITSTSFAQNLKQERIRKIYGKKRSVYFEKGIIYNTQGIGKSTLKAVRHSFVKSRGYERIVFDFVTNKIPGIYGYIQGQKLYIDLFDTNLAEGIKSFGKSKYVKKLNFFPIDNDSLSVEVEFKSKVSLDTFFLEKPGRFVVDVKK